MTREHPIRSVFLFVAFVLGASCLLSSMHCLGSVAHGATVVGDPVVAVSTGADAGWDVFKTDGPLWAVLLIAAGLLRTFISRQHWIAQGKVLSGLTGLSMVLAAVAAWHFAGAPASGILTALLAAYALITHSTVPGATPTPAPAEPPRDPQAGRASVAVMLGLVAGLAAILGVLACGSTQKRVGAGVTAGLHCEEPAVAATVVQLLPSLIETVGAAISGDGLHVDTAKLRAAAQPLKDDAFRCALEAAVAIIGTPAPAQPGAPAAASFTVDSKALGAAWSAVRGELGWPAVAAGVQ